jgi:Protein of unknown function (DUF2798)
LTLCGYETEQQISSIHHTALIIAPMTLIIAFVGVLRNYGLVSGWILKVFLTWFTMLPIAYVCAFFIIPIAVAASTPHVRYRFWRRALPFSLTWQSCGEP